MRVEQTSATTFELQSDNGCHAIAGFALETMGRPGIYFVRESCTLTKDQLEKAFMADQQVQAAIAKRVA
jgi:hypothetical protein